MEGYAFYISAIWSVCCELCMCSEMHWVWFCGRSILVVLWILVAPWGASDLLQVAASLNTHYFPPFGRILEMVGITLERLTVLIYQGYFWMLWDIYVDLQISWKPCSIMDRTWSQFPTPNRWYRLPTSHQKTLPCWRWGRVKLQHFPSDFKTGLDLVNTDQPWWCQRAWGCEQQCAGPAPSAPHQGDQPAPGTIQTFFSFIGSKRFLMHKMMSNSLSQYIGLFILLPGFCGRTGGPSQRARTAAGLLRPPRRSSWKCNQTSSSPSSATEDIS